MRRRRDTTLAEQSMRVGHYQPDGRLDKPEALRPTAIIAVPLKR